MEFLNSNKHIFTKKLLIENRKAFMKLQKEVIMKKWRKSGILDELMALVAIDTPEDEDDELDIF
jgi:hypothetical protein